MVFFSVITISPSPLIGVPSLSMLMPRRQKSLRKIKKSYLEKIQKKEGDVKLFAYNSYQIDQYVKETTTTNYADAKQPLHWDYDSNSQIYISYRPDVSPKEIKFTRGQKSGFDVTLYYKLKDANYPSTKVEHIMKLNFQGTIPKFISNMPST